jgi:hypothetical protein
VTFCKEPEREVDGYLHFCYDKGVKQTHTYLTMKLFPALLAGTLFAVSAGVSAPAFANCGGGNGRGGSPAQG